MDALNEIKELCFYDIGKLVKELGLPKSVAAIIRRQPGYDTSREMTVTQTAEGEWRLYARINGQWMDASLHNMVDDFTVSKAAAALGSIRTPRKAATSAANGKSPVKPGSRPRGRPKS